MTTAVQQRSRLPTLARAIVSAAILAALALFRPGPPTLPSSLSAPLTIETIESGTLWLLVVELVGSEPFVAFPARVFPDQLVFVLVAFAPNAAWTDWRQVEALPRRALHPGELCYSIAVYDE
jgi:hypothetical protein